MTTTKDPETTTEIVTRGGDETSLSLLPPVIALAYDARRLAAGVDADVAAKWAYQLPRRDADGNQIRGLGTMGAAEGARLLAGMGEIIRIKECVCVRDNDAEAFFQATATRYVVNPDTGVEHELETTTRGKRQPKVGQRANGSGTYEIEAWYEIGISKATRNVIIAMLPGAVKTILLNAGLEAQGNAPTANAPRQQRQQAPRQAAAPRTPAQVQAPRAETSPGTDRNKLLADARAGIVYVQETSKDAFDALLASIRAAYPHTVNTENGNVSPSKLTDAEIPGYVAMIATAKQRVDGSPPPPDEEPEAPEDVEARAVDEDSIGG